MTLVTLNNKTEKTNLGLTPLFNEVFGEFINGGTTLTNYYNKQVPVNVIQNETGYYLEFAVPGFDKTDLTLNWENNVLTVAGTKTETLNEKNYTKREFSLPSFERTFVLPENIIVDGISAEWKNGILYVTLPTYEVAKTTVKTITVL